MRKAILTLFFLTVILGGLLFLSREWLVKNVFASAVRALTGFDTEIESLRLDLGDAILHVEGLTLYNPSGFEEPIFASAREIYLRLDLPALLKKERFRIRELRLDIKQLNIEKTKAGVSNVSLLKSVGRPKVREEAGPPKPKPVTPRPKLPFQLDRLVLTLRRVSYYDRSLMVSKKLSVDMHINQQIFEGITDPKSIVNIVLMKALTAAPFGNLGVSPAELQNQLAEGMRTVRDIGGRIVMEAGPQVVGKAEGVGKKVGSVAVEEIGNLWGKLRSKVNAYPSEND